MTRQPNHLQTSRRTPTGFALVQVLVVVGIVAVMGLAMLSGSALQVQQGLNAQLAAEADTLAESGVNLAMYYLQHPARAPQLKSGYWPGGSDLSLGSGGRGRADVSVARDMSDPEIYYVTSTGKTNAGSGSGGAITRTVNAKLRVRPGLQIRHALLGGGDLTLGLNVRVTAGNVMIDGALSNYGIVLGTAWARSFPILGSITKWLTLSASARVDAPRAGALEKYENYVYADGHAYQRQTLAAASVTATTLGPTPSNPLGIFWADESLTLGDNVTINGTLIVEGDLVLNGANVKITAPAGQPALIVGGNIRTRSIRSMTVNGVTWVGQAIKGDGGISLLTTLAFNGALVFGGGAGPTGNFIDASAGTTVDIRFDPTRVDVPDMDRNLARGVTVLRWGR